MNKRVPTFLAGMLTTALISSLGVTALAATGRLTIAVDPINIQVNGQTFQPKDAQGNDVPVFSYNGTTYAPLRALAESFGLEVGYDAGANMATVGKKGSGAQAVDAPPVPTPGTLPSAIDYSSWSAEEEEAYQEFKGMWTFGAPTKDFLPSGWDDDPQRAVYFATYVGTYDMDQFMSKISDNIREKYYVRLGNELKLDDCPVTVIVFPYENGIVFVRDLECQVI